MINFCWFCFKWGLVLGVIGIAVGVLYIRDRMNEEIRCRVVDLIAQHYGDLKVTVRSAALVEEGIEIRGLSIAAPGADGVYAELVYHDEVLLECSTDLQELVWGEPSISQVTIRRPTLRVTRRLDGTWSAAKLLPLPKFSECPPTITIENGTIEIFDRSRTPCSRLTLRDINLTLTPQRTPQQSGPITDTRKLQGTFSADHVRRVEVEGQFDPAGEAWRARGTVDGLEIAPELRDALPEPLAAKLAALGELRGQGTLGFQMGHDPAAESPYWFSFSGRLKQGRIDDARLPHPLTDIHATVRADNRGFTIEELVARSGPATIRMKAHRTGFDAASPLWLEAEIRQLELDRQLMDRLPKRLQDQWRKYRPAGRIDADAKLSYDGRTQTWHPDLSVRCLNVSFTSDKFPYRLEHGKGTLTWKDDRLEVHLTAYSRLQEVRVDAEVLGASSTPTGWFQAEGNDIQLDEKLLDALRPKQRAVVHSLDPHGTVNFHLRTWREGPDQPKHKHLLIGLNRCAIRYEKFPYPLGNIRGTLEMLDDHWTFRGLEGTNDTGRVTCEGSMTPSPQGSELFLRFTGVDVPLEEELRDALHPNIQRVWDNLRPRGTVDLDEVVVRYGPGRRRPSVSIRARPQPDSTSIEPVHFPYRMENVQGLLDYHDGHVTLHRFKAEHGRVTMRAGGHCDFLPEGSWTLHLERIAVDRLRLEDRQMIQALPGRLKKAVLELKPTGPVNLSGAFTLESGVRVGDPVRSRWNLAIDFHRGNIDCGIKLENLYGSMTLAGGFNGRNFHALGELAIDSLTFKDFQFTEVIGPVWIDDRQVLFGSWVARRRNERSAPSGQQQPRPLTAKLFGGIVNADAWVAPGPQPRYGLYAGLSGAELSRYAQEAMAGQQDLRGKIMADVDLGGTGRTINGLSGRGTVRLRDADIYQLPLMIAVLKILSIREPDPTAFSKSDIGFTIRGGHIYFKPINFYGDAISLLGQGEMDFQSNIGLTFHALVGNDELQVPVLRELLGGASQQFMKIHVTGSLQNPAVRKEALPFVNEVWQQLQKDLQLNPNSQGLFPQARQWMPNVRTGLGSRR